ncbi:MAG: hypothetical protein ACJ07L_08380 [Opitutales bacterium]|jgi:hypothetical protein
MKRKRATEVFSLSFLDVICCGFGAIILLFVITMGKKTKEVTNLRIALERIIQQRMLQLNEYEIVTDEISTFILMEESKIKDKKIVEEDLDAIIAKLKEQINDKEFSKDKFVTDIEDLENELAARQTDPEIEQKPEENTPVGVSVESNHIAFVIDTSGSMRDPNTRLVWGYVIQKFEEALDSYPEVKGIQLLDANGRFIVGRGMGNSWMKDDKQTRDYMVRTLRLYPYDSESNPVPGIAQAIRRLAKPNDEEMKMGIYVFGDEFTGKSEPVLNTLDKLNKGKDGERLTLINAIGFPNLIRSALSLSQSGLKFANLMRELTYEHGGAFVALERESLKARSREIDERYPAPIPRREPRVPSIIYGPGRRGGIYGP